MGIFSRIGNAWKQAKQEQAEQSQAHSREVAAYRELQAEIAAEWEHSGLPHTFMTMHPDIHRSIVNMAAMLGVEQAIEAFSEIAVAIREAGDQEGWSDERVAKELIGVFQRNPVPQPVSYLREFRQ